MHRLDHARDAGRRGEHRRVRDCDHYAFRQKDVDWELWIEQGGRPLPRKMVITTTAEPSKPQHSMVMNWDLAPKFEDELFTFVPPATAHQIEFDVDPRANGTGKGRKSAMHDEQHDVSCRDRRDWSRSSRCRWHAAVAQAIFVRTAVDYRPVARSRALPSGRPPWSGRPPSSAASSIRCRRRARRRWSATSPTSSAATPGIGRSTRDPRSRTSSSILPGERALCASPRLRGRGHGFNESWSAV